MDDLKSISAGEFKKCGELLVAAKKNKLAMSCNFCREMFTQINAFMRHLQIQHDNHLAFHKQAKEVEVYAVEELINQSVGSSVFDIENYESNASEEDINRLSEADMKWLDEGVEPNINQQHDKNFDMLNGEDEEESLGLTNISILKALEDCDVSLNLMHNINSTKRSGLETESYLDNTLQQEIQNDCKDSSNNKITLKRIDYTEKNELKCFKKEENLNQTKITYENSPTKCTKYLLQGLENLDDVDSLLNNLETITTNKCNKVVTENAFKGIYNPENNLNENQNFNVKKQSQRNNCMLNTKSEGQILNFKQNFNKKNTKSTTVVLEMNSDIQSDGMDGFKTRFEELAHVLEDVTGTSNITIKTQKFESIPYISQNCKQSDLAQQLKEMEESHHSRNPVSYNLVINNSPESQHDFEIKLKCLGKSYNNSEILEENNSSSESNIFLNEDLTKALADALDEKDLDLLNIQQEEDEEPLNDYILNLLERELIENEKRQELPLLKDQHNLDARKAVETFKKEIKSESCYQSNVIAKYQKTNLKVKTIMAETRNETLLKPTKLLVATEFNSTNSRTIVQDFQKPLKGNHAIFLNQKQLTSIANSHKSLVRTPSNKNAMEKTPENFRQIKIPTENQENSAIAANIQNIKKETLTPFSNFVNVNRGDKTPIKREQIPFKQSPKTQEKLENSVKNITPQMSKIKQSPKTQQKQDNFNQQLTLQAAHQKISQLKNKDKLKQSSKKFSNIIKQNEQNTIIKDQRNKSAAKCLNRSNEKPLYNHTKTSLTTPNKLRNVSIKLHRYTPDKLTQQHKIQDRQISETKQQTKKDGKTKIIDRFKLPNGISLTIVPKQSYTLDANQCEISPIKTTVYWKQNFSEASLENGEQYNTKKQNQIKVSSSIIQAQSQTNNNIKAESTFSKVRQRKASIDILPSTRNVKQTAQISPHKISRNSNLDYNSYAINRSAQKKEVLQRMHKIKKQIFKSIKERECMNKIDETKSKSTKHQKKEMLVENVQILPNLNTATITPLILNDFKNNSTPITSSVSPKNLADDQKQAKLALTRSQNVSSAKDDEKLIKKSLKRQASAPLNNRQSKRQHKSSTKEQAKLEENICDLEGTQLDLSESVVDFLQRDLNANRLNVESLLNEVLNIDNYTPDENSVESSTEETKISATSNEESLNSNNILNDLLEQVENEQATKEKQATSKDKTLANSTTFKDFDDARDIDLLAKLGLKIIKLPTIEDFITLKERDIMTEKAIKFAGIYQKWPRIWSTKNFSSPTTKDEVDASFKQLLTETNQSFNLTLSMAEIKRVANLINIWYARYFNNKLIEKRKTSDSINRYICIFFYVPRTIKRYYFCEYCPEYFNTEHRYFSHRITHTGALFPYKCQKCSEGFKTVKQLNNHESLCKEDLNDRTYQSDEKDILTYSKTNRKSTTSEQSNEHTKKHLKSSYSCGKCKIVFATVKDVQNHMTKCNLEIKRMAKPHTPRPPQPK